MIGKILEVWNLLRKCRTNGNGYVLPLTRLAYGIGQHVLFGQLTARRDGVKTPAMKMLGDESLWALILEVRSKGGIRLDATQWTSIFENTAENQEKNKACICSLFLTRKRCFFLSIWHDHLSFHTLFLSPGDYLQVTVVNKTLCS